MKSLNVPVGDRAFTVFVYEYVTGGGLVGRDLPKSWAMEGFAMRRAIVNDFASVPGVRVVTTLDSRLVVEDPPNVTVRRIPDPEGSTFESLAAESDYTILIAPETDDILRKLSKKLMTANGRSLGPNRPAITLLGDKVQLAHHLIGHEIPTPQTLLLGPRSARLLANWEGSIVIKPRFGAGSVDTALLQEPRCPAWVKRDWSFVAQPFCPGRAMSASFLIDVCGEATLLAIGRQRMRIDKKGRFHYRGGTVPFGPQECPEAVTAAINSVKSVLPKQSLRGFVGVDFIRDYDGKVVILEINPRPTTSYVGLVGLFPPGTIAGAWLAARKGGFKDTEWPERLRLSDESKPISFNANGQLTPAGILR